MVNRTPPPPPPFGNIQGSNENEAVKLYIATILVLRSPLLQLQLWRQLQLTSESDFTRFLGGDAEHRCRPTAAVNYYFPEKRNINEPLNLSRRRRSKECKILRILVTCNPTPDMVSGTRRKNKLLLLLPPSRK
jgi:hypothetical protein